MRNKLDLAHNFTHNFAYDSTFDSTLSVSTHTGAGIPELKIILTQKIKKLLNNSESSFLLNTRQNRLLTQFEKEIDTIAHMLENKQPEYELIAYHLHDSISTLTELTGKTVSNKLFDTIFKEFCIGK